MTVCFVIERAKIVIGLSFFVGKEVVSVSNMVNFDRQQSFSFRTASWDGFRFHTVTRPVFWVSRSVF